MQNTQLFKETPPKKPEKKKSIIDNIEEKKVDNAEETSCGDSIKNATYSFFANIQYGCERFIAAFSNGPQGADAHFTPGGTLG